MAKDFCKTESLAAEHLENISVEAGCETKKGFPKNSNEGSESEIVNVAEDLNMSQEETEIEVLEFGKCNLPPGYFDLCQTTEIIVEKVDPVEEFLDHLKKLVNLNERAVVRADEKT